MRRLHARVASATALIIVATATPTSAQVWSSSSAGPTPFNSGATITIYVSANWTYNHYLCPSTCYPDYVEVEVFGSDGFTDGTTDFAGAEWGAWAFFDSIPGGTMQATRYTGCVTVFWWDYELWRHVSETSCSGAFVEPAPPAISGPNTMWWFNGNGLGGYATSIELSSAEGGSTQWSLVDGADKATLLNSSGEYATLVSTGRSLSTGDVRVAASVPWGSTEFTMTVRAPHSLLHVQTTYECDPTYVYLARVMYVIQDQFGVDLPSDVPINEQ